MKNSIFSLLFLNFFILFVSSTFTPTDNYLINCGSTSPSITTFDNRKFFGDNSPLSDSVILSATRTSSLSLTSHDSPIYNSVRIFTKPSNYVFSIKEKGAHIVRLHFHRFESSKFDLVNAKFHVLANGYLLLNDFSGLTMKNVEIKEFIMWVNSDNLEIMFTPSKRSNFGFINAIEVVSAPKDLILGVAQFVNSQGIVKIDELWGTESRTTTTTQYNPSKIRFAFETIYRVNVGGPKVTPFNDTLWRTWEEDDMFLESNKDSKEFHFGGRINYRNGGASREVAPDNVYNSARIISSSNSDDAKHYLTWRFPINDGFRYLVRTHFCDIASSVLGSLYFNVYVNGHLAVENLDLSKITESLASPYYADFVVNGENGVITVSIGPSNWTSSTGINALLNGVEVFKMSNSMDSFDGMVSPKWIMRRCRGGSVGYVVPLVAGVGLLVVASVVLRKKLLAVRDSVAWSPLPVDVSEVSMKSIH